MQRFGGFASVPLIFICSAWATAAAPSAKDSEFFEKCVRPILAKRCWECHGKEQAESRLRLDTPAGLFQGAYAGRL